jgi:O-antigen ligase
MTSSSVTDGPLPGGKPGLAVLLLTGTAVISVTFSVAVSSVAMAAAFVVMAAIIARHGFSSIPRSGLETAVLLYIAAELLSSAFSVKPADSFFNTKRVLLIGIVYVTAYAYRSERRIIVTLGILGAIGAVAAIAETVSLRSVNGLIERPMMFQLPLTEGGIRMMIMLVLIPFALSGALPLRWRAGVAAALVPLFAGLVITQARSAWVAFVAGVTVIGIMGSRKILAALAALVVLFMLFAPADFRNRAVSIVDIHDASNASRVQMVETGWRMFLDRPIFGWGDTGLRTFYVTYVRPLTDGEGGHLHNNLVEALVTLGVPGFCAVVYLFVMMFVVIRRASLGAAPGSFRAALSAGVMAAYAGFHVLGMFEYNFGDHEVMVLLWFLVGLAVASPGAEKGGLA